MNREEARAEWKRRLRSGDYPQTTGALCKEGGGHCCLGVLCEIMVEEGMIEKTIDRNGTICFGVEYAILPDIVTEFIGLKTANGSHLWDGSCLSSLNDKGTTFAEIASLLDTKEYWRPTVSFPE